MNKKVVALLISLVMLVQVRAEEFDLSKASLADRMHYHRAIDAAVWAMPLMNFKKYRDALVKAGVGPVSYTHLTLPTIA